MQELRVPAWFLGIVVTILLAIFTYTISTVSANASTRKQVEINTIILEQLKLEDKSLESNKADIQDIKDMKADLKEIKDLLYTHTGLKK